MKALANKVALVTGAGGACGAAIARRFCAEGAYVMAADLDAAAGAALARTLEERGGVARSVPTDVREPSDAKAMLEATLSAFGVVDILVNATNLGVRGALPCLEAVGPALRERQRGRVISLVPADALHRPELELLSRRVAGEWSDGSGTVNTIVVGEGCDPDRDVAPAALFLAGDGARRITGQTLWIDGGARRLYEEV